VISIHGCMGKGERRKSGKGSAPRENTQQCGGKQHHIATKIW